MIFLLVVLSVAISAIAQLLLKLGMSSGVVKRAIDGGDFGSMMLTIGLNPLVLGSLTLYFFGAIVWLFVLSRLPLGVAYPLWRSASSSPRCSPISSCMKVSARRRFSAPC